MARRTKTVSKRKPKAQAEKRAETYIHPEAESPLRPEIGTQAQFRKKKAPVTYRYDSSLAPALDWDGGNAARELGEWLLRQIEEAAALASPHRFERPRELQNARGETVATVASLPDAVDQLKRLGRPFLDWTGKAERLSFDVPTLPLFVHERLSTTAIIESLKSHEKRRHKLQDDMFDLFGDPQRTVADQVLKAYEYRDKWVNRLILGDSLVVMNSLLHYEKLGGQVQMIYIDPPYGVKFGSNFQPFVRRRDVKHNGDEDLTREPEMVKAYRDTWEIGLHSYLTYMRDRLLLARDLLHPSGSVFVQISDENLHHIRELMDEIFGSNNAAGLITFAKTSSASSIRLPAVSDYLLWYARDIERIKYRQVYLPKTAGQEGGSQYTWAELPDGSRLNVGDVQKFEGLPKGSRIFVHDNLTSQRPPGDFPVEFEGREYRPGKGYWKTGEQGMRRLVAARRVMAIGNTLRYIRYLEDFPVYPLNQLWSDTVISGFSAEKLYVVQTMPRTIERCILMTTDPGDLVLDPTCGSGTTAYVAEQWGRRWITIDTSRVPLALARQRILAATFPYYQLKDEVRGPSGGFIYARRKNKKGEEVGGIVPHITLKSIANDEPPAEEVLVDRPEVDNKIVRVSGPFVVEGMIPTPVDWEGDGEEDSGVDVDQHGAFLDRMLEVLRRAPVLQLGGGNTVTLRNVRPPTKSLSLSAEAVVEATAPGQKLGLGDAVAVAHERNTGGLPLSQKPVAIVFGPENGSVSEKLVYEAAREANAKQFTHLYVIGFGIQPNARELVDNCDAVVGVAATYVQATPDLMMGDLLKTMRSSQIFSICGKPDIRIDAAPSETKGGVDRYQVALLGLDTFDPITMDLDPQAGNDVPCWMLDSDYNGLVFRATQVFFPRTEAWASLRKALKSTHEETVWNHLAGSKSAPFEAGEHGQIAVKVIDDRGNELLVVKKLSEPA